MIIGIYIIQILIGLFCGFSIAQFLHRLNYNVEKDLFFWEKELNLKNYIFNKQYLFINLIFSGNLIVLFLLPIVFIAKILLLLSLIIGEMMIITDLKTNFISDFLQFSLFMIAVFYAFYNQNQILIQLVLATIITSIIFFISHIVYIFSKKQIMGFADLKMIFTLLLILDKNYYFIFFLFMGIFGICTGLFLQKKEIPFAPAIFYSFILACISEFQRLLDII